MMEKEYKLKSIFLASFMACCGMPVAAQHNYVSEVWVADKGNGTYVNPIINADYSDPDVCAVGDDFYMTASSFNCTPGLPILHSKDLVNWQIVNYALKEIEPVEFFDKPQHGKGVWAPSIRYHEGEYFIYWGDPDWGVFMVKTRNPLGEWEKPVLVMPGKGIIDTTPLWDDDGRVYLVNAWAASRSGFNSVITVRELSSDGKHVIGDPVMVYDGQPEGNHTIEGPKFYKRNGYYYILAPAGGVEKGWQVALRSKNVYGPYECKTVMAQGKTNINGPHQGGWVDTNTGESWFINFQDKEMYGRVVHLNPMKWVNDWPVIGVDEDGDGCGEPVSKYRKPDVGRTYPVQTPVESDDFDSPVLGKQWEWHANYKDAFGFVSSLGYVRLYGHVLSQDFVNFWEVPNLLLQKFPAEEFSATAKLNVVAKSDGQQSGIIVMGWDYCRIALEKQGEGFVLKQIVCKDAEQKNPEKETVIAEIPCSRKIDAGAKPNYECGIYLRVKVGRNGQCTFFYSLDGKKFLSAGNIFKARQGKWIGAKFGFFSCAPFGSDRGWMDADWIKVKR